MKSINIEFSNHQNDVLPGLNITMITVPNVWAATSAPAHEQTPQVQVIPIYAG